MRRSIGQKPIDKPLIINGGADNLYRFRLSPVGTEESITGDVVIEIYCKDPEVSYSFTRPIVANVAEFFIEQYLSDLMVADIPVSYAIFFEINDVRYKQYSGGVQVG